MGAGRNGERRYPSEQLVDLQFDQCFFFLSSFIPLTLFFEGSYGSFYRLIDCSVVF